MYYSLHYSWILLHPIYNKVTSVCSLGEEYAKSGKLHSFLSQEKRMKFFGSLIICMNRNTQRLAHFCIFDFVPASCSIRYPVSTLSVPSVIGKDLLQVRC